jgi:hypothetical protein
MNGTVTRLLVSACAALVLSVAAGCSASERCGVPGVVAACTCGGGAPGARVCQPDSSWRACDCSGAIPLPQPVRERDAGGPDTSGTGGAPPAGGAGGSSGAGGASMDVDGGDDDAGMEPIDAGGSSGTGGSGGAPADAGTIDPRDAYRGCATASDCDLGAECTITPGFPTDDSVCAPACVDTGDCPVPGGSYQAGVKCVVGRCRLDCTPVLFQPLLTCPADMQCIAAQFDLSFCHDDS